MVNIQDLKSMTTICCRIPTAHRRIHIFCFSSDCFPQYLLNVFCGISSKNRALFGLGMQCPGNREYEVIDKPVKSITLPETNMSPEKGLFQ